VGGQRLAGEKRLIMEFAAAKIFWLLVAPTNLIGICMVLAMISRLCRWWKGIDFFFGTAFLLFLVFGIIPTGPSLLAHLETQYQRPAALPDKVDGVIILGGAFDTYLSNIYGQPVLNDGVERVLDGVMIARHYKDSTLVFSGGSGRLTHRQRTEAEDAAVFLKNYPDLKDRIKFEGQSRNTWQNASMTKNMVEPKEGETWVLVTSAYHMPRAVEMFKKAGWPQMALWPTDYRTKGKMDFMPHKLDILGNLYQSHLALREIIGQSVSEIRDKLKI
jgi:uncharacterized SAM-binding protein YcdF (DUF218 family)